MTADPLLKSANNADELGLSGMAGLPDGAQAGGGGGGGPGGGGFPLGAAP